MEIFYPVDSIALSIEEIKELNEQFNCNLSDSEMNEQWFDAEELPNHVQIISEYDLQLSLIE